MCLSWADPHEGSCRRLARLIHRSLGVPPSAAGEPGPLSADSIAHCLLHFAPKVLLLVDHLDEVQWLYRPGEDVAGTGGVGPARARHVKEVSSRCCVCVRVIYVLPAVCCAVCSYS